jgi:hypothetical protein
MAWRQELSAARIRWGLMTFYQKFEHAVILLLTGVITADHRRTQAAHRASAHSYSDRSARDGA